MLPRIGLIVLAVPILPLTSVTCQETLNLFKDAMDSSLLSNIHDFIAYRNTKGCVAIFDVASDLTGSMILYYQIQHMKFEFPPVNFRKVLDVELSHDRIRHGTMRVDEHRNEILIDTLVSEMDRDYTSLYMKMRDQKFTLAGVRDSTEFRRFKLVMLSYHQEISRLIDTKQVPAPLVITQVSKWQRDMKFSDVVTLKSAAQRYFEELNYKVTVKDKVIVSGIQVPVKFTIVSPPPQALGLIKFFKKRNIPSLVVQLSEYSSITSRKHILTSNITPIPPLSTMDYGNIIHYTLYRPNVESVNVKLTFDTHRSPIKLDPAKYKYQINPDYSPLNEVYPGETEAAQYMRTLKPCFVFSNAKVDADFLKVIRKGVIVAVQHLKDKHNDNNNGATKHQGPVEYKRCPENVSVFQQYVDRNGNWVRQLPKSDRPRLLQRMGYQYQNPRD